jgi:hypothetical protein
MNKSFFQKVFEAIMGVVAALVLLLSITMLINACNAVLRAGCGIAQAEQAKTVSLKVDNPYSLAVRLLVECNWNQKLKKYDYREFIWVRAHQNRTIFVPGNLTSCFIWPKVYF